jgi:hypothetical protein
MRAPAPAAAIAAIPEAVKKLRRFNPFRVVNAFFIMKGVAVR